MKRLVQILLCVVAALALIPVHGETPEAMEYEIETEIAVANTYATDFEPVHETQEVEVVPTPLPQACSRACRFHRVTTDPCVVARFVRFCVFRE